MREVRIELLQGMPIFGGISTDVLAFLLDLTEIVSVPQGSFFFREDDIGSSMFVLEVGTVGILKKWKGHDYLLRYLGKGDCFGEMALLDLCPRSASVLAIEHCTAIRISTTAFQRLYERDMEQFTIIYMNMGREVSRRLRVADERLFEEKVEERITSGDYVRHPL